AVPRPAGPGAPGGLEGGHGDGVERLPEDVDLALENHAVASQVVRSASSFEGPAADRRCDGLDEHWQRGRDDGLEPELAGPARALGTGGHVVRAGLERTLDLIGRRVGE